MFPFKRILFAVDFSDACRHTAPYVLDMAQRAAARLTLLHAFEPLPDILPLQTSRAAQSLADFAHDVLRGRHAELVVRPADPADAIAEAVRDQGFDLVMLPTHGRGVLRRMLLGSVTAKVLHDLCCPVWTAVHAAEPDFEGHLPYRRILCATGLDDEAEALVKAAHSVARSCGAALTVAHVIETPPVRGEDHGPLFKSLTDSANLQLHAWLREWGIDAPVHVTQGHIPDRLRALVLREDADLLVTGRGAAQGRVSRLWSHLYGIVSESPCPVLSI